MIRVRGNTENSQAAISELDVEGYVGSADGRISRLETPVFMNYLPLHYLSQMTIHHLLPQSQNLRSLPMSRITRT